METHTEPFHFGENQRLLGFHTKPRGTPATGSVLLCPSVLSDTTRSHWSLRSLSLQLASTGWDVFRFDFSGCGNSGGGPSTRRPVVWVDDLRAAHAEVVSRSGAAPRNIFALRAGALLWELARDLGPAERVVYWDPIVTGPELYADLKALQDVYEARAGGGHYAPALGGHAVVPDLEEELHALERGHHRGQRVLVLQSVGSPGGLGLEAKAQEKLEWVALDPPYDWSTWELHILYPHDVISHTTDWLTS